MAGLERLPTAGPSTSPPRPDHVVDTELGGLFYLLNFAQYLGLYGDFTTPASTGLDLDPWDLLTLLGRELVGRPVRDDPVWGLLRILAGQGPGDLPGGAFDPPARWRTPDAWLRPFEESAPWTWSAAGGRLRLEHPAGFPALDVPRTREAPATQLRRELRRCRLCGLRPVRRALRPLPAAPLRRWIVALADYARARLSVALGHSPERVSSVLLEHPARVFATSVHVDVALALAELPIEIRMAGLDRDPGWIPAAGRIVTFHFD